MNNFKITVIIPTFNREDFIDDCINSILSTNDSNIEIIIVDNNSKDKTKLKLKKYKTDERFKIFFNKKNLERSYSRNLGLINATGDFVTLLDSDDKLKKNIFSEFRSYYKKNNKYNIYYSNFNTYDPLTKQTKISSNNFNNISLRNLSNGNYLSNICVFLKNNLSKTILYDESSDIIGIEDYDFNLRIINKFGIAKKFSNYPLGVVTDHINRSVNLDSIVNAEKRFLFFKNKLFNNLDYKNVNLRIKYSILSTSSLYVSLICMKNKNKLKSLKYIYIALINNIMILIDKRFFYIVYGLIFKI